MTQPLIRRPLRELGVAGTASHPPRASAAWGRGWGLLGACRAQVGGGSAPSWSEAQRSNKRVPASSPAAPAPSAPASWPQARPPNSAWPLCVSFWPAHLSLFNMILYTAKYKLIIQNTAKFHAASKQECHSAGCTNAKTVCARCQGNRGGASVMPCRARSPLTHRFRERCGLPGVGGGQNPHTH